MGLIYASDWAVLNPDAPDANDQSSGWFFAGGTGSDRKRMLLKFSNPDGDAYKYRRITGLYLYVFSPLIDGQHWPLRYASFGALNAPFDGSTVTWNTAPASSPDYGARMYDYTYVGGAGADVIDASGMILTTPRFRISDALQNGFLVKEFGNAFSEDQIGTPTGAGGSFSYDPDDPARVIGVSTDCPALLVVYSDSDATGRYASISPQNGSRSLKSDALRISWSYSVDREVSWEMPSVSGYTLCWRNAGESAYNRIDVGTANEYTFPANFFSADSIEFYIEALLNHGGTLSSSVRTILTSDTVPTAEPISPMGLIDCSTPVELRWSHNNDTGTAQTAADLQQRIDSAWSDLAAVSGSADTYTVAAGTIPAGAWAWRVRTYNADGVAGEWSTPAECVAVGASPAPSVSAEGSPLPLITWQSEGQQGYRVRIDDIYDSGVRYGEEKSFRADQLIPEGEHIVRVSVCNRFSLWSEEGEAVFTVENISPGGEILLLAESGLSVSLAWSASIPFERFALYRDSKLIAVTTSTEFVDLLATGSASYRVLGFVGGDYTASNEASAVSKLDTLAICDIETGEWLRLCYSEEQYRVENLTLGRSVSYFKLSGKEYPTAICGESSSKTISFVCAFQTPEEERALRALIGKEVVVKTRRSDVVRGPLEAASIASGRFYSAYDCAVRHTGAGEEARL